MSGDLKFHPLADIFPLLEGAEFEELVADIKANGLRNGIVLYDETILDGRNRYRACLAAGVQPVTVDGRKFITDPAAFVISANIHRRHLTAEQKRDLIEKLIKAQPEKSNRQIAKASGVSHPHVAKVRSEMEEAGDVETVSTSIDTKGRKQPAKKAKAGEMSTTDTRADAEQRRARRERALEREQAKKRSGEWRASISRLADKLVKLDIEMARELYVILLGGKSHSHLADDLEERLDSIAQAPKDAEPAPTQGNDIDPETAAEKRKAEMAALDGGSAETSEPAKAQPKKRGRPKGSKPKSSDKRVAA